jgi:hypothetical protein
VQPSDQRITLSPPRFIKCHALQPLSRTANIMQTSLVDAPKVFGEHWPNTR